MTISVGDGIESKIDCPRLSSATAYQMDFSPVKISLYESGGSGEKKSSRLHISFVPGIFQLQPQSWYFNKSSVQIHITVEKIDF